MKKNSWLTRRLFPQVWKPLKNVTRMLLVFWKIQSLFDQEHIQFRSRILLAWWLYTGIGYLLELAFVNLWVRPNIFSIYFCWFLIRKYFLLALHIQAHCSKQSFQYCYTSYKNPFNPSVSFWKTSLALKKKTKTKKHNLTLESKH